MYTDPFSEFVNGQPYWSILPLQFGDFPDPYHVGDFPISKQERIKRGWTKVSDYMEDKKANLPPDIKNILGKSIYDQQVWSNNIDDSGVTFTLEIPGCAKENITAQIKGDVLVVNGAYEKKIFSESWVIPSAKSLDLENLSAKVENGILKIIFPTKKQEVKTIKVL